MKTTLLEDKLAGRRAHRKMTSQEDNLTGAQLSPSFYKELLSVAKASGYLLSTLVSFIVFICMDDMLQEDCPEIFLKYLDIYIGYSVTRLNFNF